MQKSARRLNLALIFVVLCASSQALPLLEHPLVAKNADPESNRDPLPIRNAEETGSAPSDRYDDIVALYGLPGRDVDAAEHSHYQHDHEGAERDLHLHDFFPYHHQSQITFLNTPALSFQAADPSTTTPLGPEGDSVALTPDPTPHHAEIVETHSDVNNNLRIPSLSVPVSIPAPRPAPATGTASFTGLAPLDDLHAPQRHDHEHDHQPHVSRPRLHDGHSWFPFFRPDPIFGPGEYGRKPISDVKHGVANSDGLMGALARLMRVPLPLPPGIGPAGQVHIMPPPARKPRVFTVLISGEHIPNPFSLISKLFSVLDAPLRVPGVGPGGRIYLHPQPTTSPPIDAPTKQVSPLEGIMHMASATLTHNHSIPLHFALTPSPTEIPTPSRHRCFCLPRDLATIYIRKYPLGLNPPRNTLSETVAMGLAHGARVKMTMELAVDGGIKGTDFKDLLGLLVSAKRKLDVAAWERGLQPADITVDGEWKGVTFRAGWLWG